MQAKLESQAREVEEMQAKLESWQTLQSEKEEMRISLERQVRLSRESEMEVADFQGKLESLVGLQTELRGKLEGHVRLLKLSSNEEVEEMKEMSSGAS
mmetsp:Transcript_491/g.856  ORF Transcript_491/g.856 Transcript_491/m.856 type:complete len:98 (+) Transcript_491:2-295(+)